MSTFQINFSNFLLGHKLSWATAHIAPDEVSSSPRKLVPKQKIVNFSAQFSFYKIIITLFFVNSFIVLDINNIRFNILCVHPYYHLPSADVLAYVLSIHLQRYSEVMSHVQIVFIAFSSCLRLLGCSSDTLFFKTTHSFLIRLRCGLLPGQSRTEFFCSLKS